MARIYAKREDTGGRVLVAIQCDWCGREVKPGTHELLQGGWRKGVRTKDGRVICEADACPDHAADLNEIYG